MSLRIHLTRSRLTLIEKWNIEGDLYAVIVPVGRSFCHLPFTTNGRTLVHNF